MNEIFEWIKEGKETGPQILMLSPTDYCNLQCKTCWRLRKNMKFAQPSFSFLIKMIRQAKEIRVKTIDLTGGGEPFFRKDILKLIGEVKRLGLKGILTTNGTLIQKNDAKKIVKIGWDELNFSLDGSTPEINDYIRGRGVFQKCLQTIKLIQKIKKIEKAKEPFLRLNFTITQKNFQDIPNFIEFSHKIGINNINFSVLFEWETNKEFWVKKTQRKEVDKFLKKGIRTAKKLEVKTNLEVVKKYAKINQISEKFLKSPIAPIVIIPKINQNDFKYVSPYIHNVGIMLPYSPLHLLIFDSVSLDFVIATSCNKRGEPLKKDFDLTLFEMADHVVDHNRFINMRIDDSVVRVENKRGVVVRRARGYVPLALKVPDKLSKNQMLHW